MRVWAHKKSGLIAVNPLKSFIDVTASTYLSNALKRERTKSEGINMRIFESVQVLCACWLVWPTLRTIIPLGTTKTNMIFLNFQTVSGGKS
jgi:hypothetical protein